MTISKVRVLHIFVVALAISCISATPLKRSKSKLARQIELTTPSSVVEQQTGYPEAGFRPRISFDLPNEVVTEQVTESVERTTTTTTDSALEDFNEIIPTTVVPELKARIPADSYGAPADSSDDTEEVDAVVVPAPAKDFQPPSEEPSQDFASTFNVINNNDGNVIVDLPVFDQTPETVDIDVTISSKQVPADTYGAPELDVEPKTDVETVEQKIELQEQPQDEDAEEEGLAEFEPELASVPLIPEPVHKYGAPKTEPEEDNEFKSELEEVEQQLEILSRLTKSKTGRLVILPLQNNLYFGRLVSSQPLRAQRQNGRLLKL